MATLDAVGTRSCAIRRGTSRKRATAIFDLSLRVAPFASARQRCRARRTFAADQAAGPSVEIHLFLPWNVLSTSMPDARAHCTERNKQIGESSISFHLAEIMKNIVHGVIFDIYAILGSSLFFSLAVQASGYPCASFSRKSSRF